MGLTASTQRAEKVQKAIKAFERRGDEDSVDCAFEVMFDPSITAAQASKADTELVKHVQYLPAGTSGDASSKFDAAVMAGILEIAAGGAKSQTISHLQRKAIGTARALLPAGTTAAFEKQLDRLNKLLLVSLTEELSADVTEADHTVRPDVLEKGMQVQRGPDWYGAAGGLACLPLQHMSPFDVQERRKR